MDEVKCYRVGEIVDEYKRDSSQYRIYIKEEWWYSK